MHFPEVTPDALRLFWLYTLLRGRRRCEVESGSCTAGDWFVLQDMERLFAFGPAIDGMERLCQFRVSHCSCVAHSFATIVTVGRAWSRWRRRNCGCCHLLMAALRSVGYAVAALALAGPTPQTHRSPRIRSATMSNFAKTGNWTAVRIP